MNEVVPDWATNPCDPNAIIHCEDADAEWVRKAYKEEIDRLCEENKRLRKENAELREKCMTNMERIQSADKHELAAMLLGIHAWGYTDAYAEYCGSPFYAFEDPEDVENWLELREWEL